jgi:hypothetical protein
LKGANLRRKWSTTPKAAAIRNQPSHLTVWRLFVSRSVTALEIARVLVRLSYFASRIVNANHGIM